MMFELDADTGVVRGAALAVCETWEDDALLEERHVSGPARFLKLRDEDVPSTEQGSRLGE